MFNNDLSTNIFVIKTVQVDYYRRFYFMKIRGQKNNVQPENLMLL